MSASHRFWDRMAKRYARRPIPDEAVYQRKLAITRDYFHPGMSVLEIGCGSGMTAISHAPYVRHIHGVDGSGNMIEIARGKARDANATNVSFERMAFENFIAADESYDAVLALSVLHLLDDWRAAIGRIHRMLKPGGIFASNTVCIDDINAPLKLALRLGGKLGIIPRVQFISLHELIHELQVAGFAIDQRLQPGDARTVFLVARKTT